MSSVQYNSTQWQNYVVKYATWLVFLNSGILKHTTNSNKNSTDVVPIQKYLIIPSKPAYILKKYKSRKETIQISDYMTISIQKIIDHNDKQLGRKPQRRFLAVYKITGKQQLKVSFTQYRGEYLREIKT